MKKLNEKNHRENFSQWLITPTVQNTVLVNIYVTLVTQLVRL